MMEKLNKKSKSEQLFLVMLLFVLLLGVFCVMGCGGRQSCETPKCGSEEIGDANAYGCSIPGCGGCLSSGKGCNTACWPQSCKYVCVSTDDAYEETKDDEVVRIIGCDTRYFGDGCLGCDQSEKSCYTGCLRLKDEDMDSDVAGCFYGSTDAEEEMIIGCANGCGGCVGSDDLCADIISWLEYETGVE